MSASVCAILHDFFPISYPPRILPLVTSLSRPLFSFNANALRDRLCMSKLGMPVEKADEMLLPVIKAYDSRQVRGRGEEHAGRQSAIQGRKEGKKDGR